MRTSGKKLVDMTIIASLVTLTVVTVYLYAVHVEITYPLTMAEMTSYRLRGNEVQKAMFGLATVFSWFGAAYYFAGRWAERKP